MGSPVDEPFRNLYGRQVEASKRPQYLRHETDHFRRLHAYSSGEVALQNRLSRYAKRLHLLDRPHRQQRVGAPPVFPACANKYQLEERSGTSSWSRLLGLLCRRNDHMLALRRLRCSASPIRITHFQTRTKPSLERRPFSPHLIHFFRHAQLLSPRVLPSDLCAQRRNR